MLSLKPKGKGACKKYHLISFSCLFMFFDQAWSLIVSIPDLCHLIYLDYGFGSYNNFQQVELKLY